MKFAEVESQYHPLLQITLNPVEPTPAQLEAYFREFQTMLDNLKSQPGKAVLLVDATKAKFLSSQTRISIGKFLKENDALMKNHLEVVVQVIPNTILTIVLKGIYLVQKPSISTEISDNLERGMLIAQKYLNKDK